MQRPLASLAAALAAVLLCASAHGIEPDAPAETGSVARLGEVGEHWVWVADALLAHSLLYDGDTGEVMASIDAGTTISPKPPIYAPGRGEFYSVEIDYSRGRRGDRVDYVTIYDAETLAVDGEILMPTRAGESAASIGYTALLDDERFLLVFSQFPVASAAVVDLESRRFVGAIPIAGCAGLYATGARSFATLCGDGSVMQVSLDEGGRKRATSASEAFFDAVADPVMMAGARLGDRWVFVSFEGTAHEVDFAENPPAASGWSLVDDGERASGWRPGGRQLLALHRASGRLYVIFHQGGPGSHKDPGPEVWVYDLTERQRVDRFAMPNFTAAFLGDLLQVGSNGFTGWLLGLLPDGGATTITVSQDEAPLLFARHSDLGSVAVLDARTGEHLRDLTQAGITGGRLEVP